MAVHLGATRGLGLQPPTLDISLVLLVPADFQVPHAALVVSGWFGLTLTIPLLMADLVGVILHAL